MGHFDPINILFGVGTLIAIGMIILASRGGSGRINTDIDNEIIGYDPKTQAYKVRAKTSRNIEGDSKHVQGNLPANVLYGGEPGTFIVDPNHAFDSRHDRDGRNKVKWQPVEPGYEILPRGATKTDGFLADEMLGYEHNYIHKKGTPRPDGRNKGLRKY